MIRKAMLLMCLGLVATAVLYAANKEQKRLENSGVVMQEIMSVPDNIPQEVIEKAECVIVFPSVLKAAFVVGASYGRGAMVCRTGKDFRGPWGAPAMYALEGGSVGFQIGGQATDLVLLVMNKRGADPSSAARLSWAETLRSRQARLVVTLPRIPTPICAPKSSAIRARVDSSRAFRSRVPPCARTTTLPRTSMAANSPLAKS